MVDSLSSLPEWIEALALAIPVVVGLIVWLIRLEGRVNVIEKAQEKLEIKHDALDNRIVEKLSAIEKLLARIQGRLSISDDPNT